MGFLQTLKSNAKKVFLRVRRKIALENRKLNSPDEGETPFDMALREGNAEIVNALKR